MSPKPWLRLLPIVGVAAALAAAPPCWAASSGSGSGHGLQVNIAAVALVTGNPLATLSLGPSPNGVSGAAPPDFNVTGTSVSILGSILSGAVSVGSGTLNATTNSALGANAVQSAGSVQNFNAALGSLLSLTAQAVASSATASCSAGSVVFTGSSTLTNVAVGGAVGSPSVVANPAANTILLNVLGVRIVLNEQIPSGNTFTVNAIHVTLNNAVLSGLGVLSGDIYVAQSRVTMSDCALPDLAISKSGPSTATVGLPFDFAVNVSNVGAAPTAGAVTVTDVIPSGLAINSVTPSAEFSCSTLAQTVTCTAMASLPSGVADVLVAAIHVTPTVAGPVSNTASVAGGGDNSPGNNTSSPVNTSVGAAPVPDLTPTLTGPTTATVGVPFPYSISLSNVGTASTSGSITVSDTLQAGLTIDSAGAGPGFSCAVSLQTVTCTSSAPLAAGVTNALAVTINVTPTAAGPVSNQASVSGGGDVNPANNASATVNTTVNPAPAPDLTPTLTGPTTATVGTAFNYAISLSNVGTGATSGVITVTDSIPPGLTINNVTPATGFSCSVLLQAVACTSSTSIAAGVANVPVATINVTPTVAGPISNHAAVAGGADTNPSNDASPPLTTTISNAPIPDLAIVVIGPATATVGAIFDYTIELSNVGTGPTAGLVAVTDAIPAGLTISSVSAGADFTCATVSQTVSCTTTTALPAGIVDVPVAIIRVTPTLPGTVNNSAAVTGGGDESPGNNASPPLTTTVNAALVPDLAPTLSGPSTATVGVAFDYVVSISNLGTGASSGLVTVTDTLPAGLTIDSVAAGPGFSCGTSLQVVTCTTSTPIASGATVLVATITVTPLTVGPASNLASVAGGGDVDIANNDSPPLLTTVNAAPVPDLAPTLTGPTEATVGTAFDYTLGLSNIGTGTSSGLITVTDTIPPGLTIDSVTSASGFTCSTLAQTVTCTSLAPVAGETLGLPVAAITVTPTAAGLVSNDATVAGGGDANALNNTSPPSISIVSSGPAPDITIDVGGPSSATVGTPFDYVIALANVGTGASAGTVTVTDIIPPGLTVNGVTGGANFNCSILAQVVTCTSNAAIGAGAANVIAAVIDVLPTLPGAISNSASVSAIGDIDITNDISPVLTTIVGNASTPDLAIALMGPVSATVGVPFNYTITLSNVGTGPTSGLITITDTLPAGLTIDSVTAGTGFSCSTLAQTVTCAATTPLLNGVANAPAALVSVTPTLAGAIANSAAVVGGGDTSPGNNIAAPVITTISALPVPDLAPTLTGPVTATVGVAFDYAVSLSNVGSGPTAGIITVVDAIPVGLTIDNIVAAPNFNCSQAAQTVTCTSTSVLPGGVVGVPVVTITVTPALPGSISNSATVAGGGDTSPSNDVSPSADTTISPALIPDLAPSLSGPAIASVGTAFDYNVTLSNVGTGSTAGTITITDAIPPGLAINGVVGTSGFSCTVSLQIVSCTSTAIITSGTIDLPVATINVTPTAPGAIANAANVAGGGDASIGNDMSAPSLTNVLATPAPDLTILLTGPATATVGTAFDYLVSLSNPGTAASTGSIVISDAIPAALTINSTSGAGGFSCSVTLQTVTCTSSVPISSGVLDAPVVTINVTPTAAGPVTNMASVAGGGDANALNDASPPVTTLITVALAADLTISKSGPPTATVGTAFDYVITLANVGTGPTAGLITVGDTLPAGLTIANVTAGAGFNCTSTTNAVTCTSAVAFAANTSNITAATIDVMPSFAAIIDNTAFVSGGGDTNATNNSAPQVTTIVGSAPAPDLAIAKSGPPTAIVGLPFDYVIALSNVGTGPTLGAISVTDMVPSTLTVNSVSAGANFACSISSQTVTCTSSTMIAAGASNVPVVTIHVTPAQQGVVSNQAIVTGGGDTSPGNNTSFALDTEVTPGGGPSPDLTANVTGPAVASLGRPFQYAIRISNLGTGPTSGAIVVTDVLASSLTIGAIMAAPGFSCSLVGRTITCTSTDAITGGTTNVLVATVVVTPTQLGSISNFVTVSGGSDANPSNDSSPTLLTSVVPAPVPATVPVPMLSKPALVLLMLIVAALGLFAASGIAARRRKPVAGTDPVAR